MGRLRIPSVNPVWLVNGSDTRRDTDWHGVARAVPEGSKERLSTVDNVFADNDRFPIPALRMTGGETA